MRLASTLRRALLVAALPLLAAVAYGQNFQITGAPDANGIYVQSGTHNGRPYYRVGGQARYLYYSPANDQYVEGAPGVDSWVVGTALSGPTTPISTELYYYDTTAPTPPVTTYLRYFGQAASAAVAGTSLPVELVSFTAAADGDRAVLRWATASETNNAGFHVERAVADDWRAVAFVAGRGTTAERQSYAAAVPGLAPGVHRFRLRQVDLDGTAHVSPVVEATVVPGGPFALTAPRPNPTTGAARLTLVARDAQRIRATAHDALGREVAVLHDGPVAAGASVSLVLDGGGLPVGAYVVRVTGERFTTAVPVTVAR